MPCLSSVDLQGLLPLQRRVTTMVRLLDLCLTGDPLKPRAVKLLPPENVFGDYMKQLPALYQEIRDHLDRNGVELTTYSSYCIALTLANGL